MQEIIKSSYVYQFFVMLNQWINRLFSNSFLVQTLVKNKEASAVEKGCFFVKLIEKVLGVLRKFAKKIKLDLLFENSIFAKPILWVGFVVVLTPFLPTMLTLLLVVAAFLSLLLKAVIDEGFQLKYIKTNIWIMLLVVVVAFSAFTSMDFREAIKIALLVIAFVLFYFVLINSVENQKQLNVLLFLFVMVGVLTSIYGIMQYIKGDIYAQAWLDTEMFEDIKMRVYSTFANPNVFGEYLLLVVPVAAALFWESKGTFKKLFFLGATGITLLALVLTFSRGCWLGIILALGILAVIMDRRFMILGVFLLLLAPFFLPESIMNRFLSIGNMGDSSTSYRVYIWMGTIAMLKDYWLSGIGLGRNSFNRVYPLYAYNDIVAPHSHNLYLQLIVEYGIMGLVVFLGAMYYFYKETISSMLKKKNIVLGALIASVSGFLLQSMFDNTWYNYRVILIFWMVIAMGVSLARLNKESSIQGKVEDK